MVAQFAKQIGMMKAPIMEKVLAKNIALLSEAVTICRGFLATATTALTMTLTWNASIMM